MPEPRCVYCNLPVDPLDRSVWHLVVGWERPGRAGGSDIALRQRSKVAKHACPVCVRRLQQGVNPNQGSLV